MNHERSPLDSLISPSKSQPSTNQGWPQGPPVAMPVSASSSNMPVFVAVGCAGVAFMTLCAVGFGAVFWGITSRNSPTGGGLAGGAPSATGSTTVRVRAQVTSYTGSGYVPVGSVCDMPIEQVYQADGSYWCHVRLNCGGLALYGSEENGFFPCTFYAGPPGSVNGQDPQTTTSDRDGAFMVNTDARVFEAHDDGAGPLGYFAVTGTIIAIE